MDYPSNNVSGSVDTNGGHFINGNGNAIVNVIDGLSFLLSDYQSQLESINNFIREFKPKTALDLLLDLEKRIKESKIPKDNKIESKILFLKALCKRELENYSKEDSARDFIKAYKLNIEDEELKIRACIEFLNVNDFEKAGRLADEILIYDDYNVTAWFVKSINSNDLISFLKTVPNIVFVNYNFHHSIIYQILSKHRLMSFDELKDYGLELYFDFEKYKIVSFENKQAWVIALDLMISRVINSSAFKCISDRNFILENNSEIETLIKLLNKYIETLAFTEISETTRHQKFYLNYLKYLTTNDLEYGKSIDLIYNQTEKPYWFYTQYYCQFLNHKKEFQNSLNCLLEYEKLKGELHCEFYLFKTIALHNLGKIDEIDILADDYLNSIEMIDERHFFNLINIFIIVKQFIDDENVFVIRLNKLLQKIFINDLKVLMKCTIQLKHSKEYDAEEVYKSLSSIKNNIEFTVNYKNLIAENLDIVGKPLEALFFMDTYINKSMLSETLRLYILILNNQLQNKEDTPKGTGKELLELLFFWRKNSKNIDEQLLCIEHHLCAMINDFTKLKEIDELLCLNFPHNYKYLYLYLASLEVTHNYNKIKVISSDIPSIFDDEHLGINIAGVLLRNNNNLKKGCEILYNLALDKNNTDARMNYFGMAITINSFFKSYKIVELGYWVIYTVDNKKEKLQIVKSTGIQKDLLGKKLGEVFSRTHPMTGKRNSIKVVEIFNDALNLFREIEEEAKNPANDLGLYSLELPSDIKDFPEFLIEQFGANGSNEKKHKDQWLDDYYNFKSGYVFIVNAIFKSNFVEAYTFLTKAQNSKFITIPNKLTADIDTQNHSLKFILDFSSLMLFHSLSQEFNFEFRHKFVISFNTRHQIESYINIERNFPESNLSMNITLEGVENHFYPEGTQDKRIDFLQSILDWIDKNCEIDLVEEKLDVILKLPNSEDANYETIVVKTMIDSMYLSIRENHRLISSDLNVFKSKMSNNFLNPEKYLLTFYPEKCNLDFYRYLLKSNYVGIEISFELLKNEFIDYIGGRKNHYLFALENLQFFICTDPNVIWTCVEFFQFLNDSPLPVAAVKKLISEVRNKSVIGMGSELIQSYNRLVQNNVNFRFI